MSSKRPSPTPCKRAPAASTPHQPDLPHPACSAPLVEVLHLRLLLCLDSLALRHGELWLLQRGSNAVVSQYESGVKTALQYAQNGRQFHFWERSRDEASWRRVLGTHALARTVEARPDLMICP